MFSASWIYPNSVKYVPADGFFGIRIDAPLDTLVGWEKGYPLPILHPIDAFGVESRVRPPEIQNILRRRCWRTQQLDLV